MPQFDNLFQINSNKRIDQLQYLLEMDAINEIIDALSNDTIFDKSLWDVDKVIKHGIRNNKITEVLVTWN